MSEWQVGCPAAPLALHTFFMAKKERSKLTRSRCGTALGLNPKYPKYQPGHWESWGRTGGLLGTPGLGEAGLKPSSSAPGAKPRPLFYFDLCFIEMLSLLGK